MKYPAVYIYKKTSDKGRELRYSLRSLVNLADWDGRVFVVGDSEGWFSDNIVHIGDFTRSHLRYTDAQNKLRAAISDKRVPDDFILFNDDIYIMEPTTLEPLYDGELEHVVTGSEWQQSKSMTRQLLIDRGATIRDYETHTPLLLNKAKLADVLAIPGIEKLQFRSVYGNLHSVGGKQYKDQKTRTNKLPTAPIVSSSLFCPELITKFPDLSEFEK